MYTFGKVICVVLQIEIWRYLTSKQRVNCDNEIENEKVLKILVEPNKSELCDEAEGQESKIFRRFNIKYSHS